MFFQFLFFINVSKWYILVLVWLFLVLPSVVIFSIGILLWCNYFYTIEEWPAFKTFWLWEWIRTKYFQYSIEGSLEKQGIWAVYPHGIFPWTPIFFWALNPKFSNIKPCIHSAIFKIPIVREFAFWIGCTTVEKKNIRNALNEFGSVILTPGGLSDIPLQNNDIKTRFGFLKIAKETNTPVIPVWIPDERSMYSTWQPMSNKWPVFFWGLFMFIPKKIKIRIRIGQPISLEKLSLEQGYELFYKKLNELQINV